MGHKDVPRQGPMLQDRFRPTPCYSHAMTQTGAFIQETGTLIRDGGGFALRCDRGRHFRLELHRVPVDHVEKRVRVTGRLMSEGMIDVDGVAPA